MLSSGANGESALIVEVAKDPDKTHPYRGKELAQVINTQLDGKWIMNSHDIVCIRQVYNIEHNAEMYYKSKYGTPQYSDKFLTWIVDQFAKDPSFFTKTRQKAKSLTSFGNGTQEINTTRQDVLLH